MVTTLDNVFVPACQQMLASMKGILRKAQAHAKETGMSEDYLFTSRLAEDMWPLPNQIQSMWMHSAYAIDQMKSGTFTPNIQNTPKTWDEMYRLLVEAETRLNALKEGELEAIAQNTVHFVINNAPRFKFTVRNFLLSFSMPNVQFHTSTAYGILRMKGIDIGKFDYLGPMRNDPM